MNNRKDSATRWLEGGDRGGSGAAPIKQKPKQAPLKLTPAERKIWHEVMRLLVADGIVSALDLPLVDRYCELRAMWDALKAQLAQLTPDFEDKGQTSMRAYLLKCSLELRQIEGPLGLSPLARTRIGKETAAEEEDPLEALRKRRQNAKGGNDDG